VRCATARFPSRSTSPENSDATWLVRSGGIRVRRGSYRWSFAIRDEQTGITSYLTFDRALP
jgi:hypothetical protein